MSQHGSSIDDEVKASRAYKDELNVDSSGAWLMNRRLADKQKQKRSLGAKITRVRKPCGAYTLPSTVRGRALAGMAWKERPSRPYPRPGPLLKSVFDRFTKSKLRPKNKLPPPHFARQAFRGALVAETLLKLA